MKKTALENWKVAGFWPYIPFFGQSMETGFQMSGVTPSLDAKVPGSVYDDLLRANLIKDPEIEINSIECEWVANRWWVYENKFKFEKGENKRQILVFEGIDYEAVIFLNGKQIAEHIGMYTQCRVDVTDILKQDGENLLIVVIKNAPDEMGQIGRTSLTHTQKARFNYRWDFSTRIVNLGLYKDVYIEEKGNCEISHPLVDVVDVEKGDVLVSCDIDCKENTQAEVNIILKDNAGKTVATLNKKVFMKYGQNSICEALNVANPELWWPAGYGEHPVYTASIEIKDCAGSDFTEFNFCFRTLSYEQCVDAREDSLKYMVVINGVRIYMHGTNFVPMEMLYGCVTEEDYKKMIEDIAVKANINTLRVWGGGLIESETLYNLCDKHGIMIWQEFIQSSSGLDNIPSKIPEFLKLLAGTVEAAVYAKRNHPSLVFWGGGNELQDAPDKPSGFGDPNIDMMYGIVSKLDKVHQFMPTSATGPREFLNVDCPGENHDVHGPWNYGGPVAHYDMYNRSDSQLQSEFGCNGMSDESTIRHICGEHIGCLDNSDPVWRHHGEWWNALARDVDVVGKPVDMTEMMKMDQFIQAESIRYSVESNRRRAFQNCGSLIWVLNEPWPNTANCSLVDHYFNRKLACKLARQYFAPITSSLKYSSLYLNEGAQTETELFVHNDTRDTIKVTVKYEIIDNNDKVVDSKETVMEIGDNTRKSIDKIIIPKSDVPMIVKITIDGDGIAAENRYLFLTHKGTPESAERRLDIEAVNKYYDTAQWMDK